MAELLDLKPFKVVADVLHLGQFKHADELIEFSTAAIIAQKHGYEAERMTELSLGSMDMRQNGSSHNRQGAADLFFSLPEL